MDARLSQNDFEDLSAYMDGQLTGDALRRVEGALRTDAAWRAALERYQALDRAMEAYMPPPAPADLAGRIVRAADADRVQQVRHAERLRWLAPLAAAAALVAAVVAYQAFHRPAGRPADSGGTPAVAVTNEAEGPIDYFGATFEVAGLNDMLEEHLDFFRDYPVVKNLDTIEAIYNQETRRQGT